MIEIDMTMHPKDHMLTANKEAYLRTSRAGLKCVQNAISSIDKQPDTIRNILDFGCGYGRVLRALRAGYPKATITACDLMEEATKFCADTFDAVPVTGYDDLTKIELIEKFDVIWVGSVFTHLPVERWEPLLNYFQKNLAPNGVLVFTIHGRTALWVFENHTLAKSHMTEKDFSKVKKNYKKSGYAFYQYPSRHVNSLSNMGIQVSKSAYGLSFTRPDWTCNYLLKFKDLFLSNYTEGGWGRNHDVVSLWLPSDPRDV